MTAQASHPPEFIKLLAHDLRWMLLKALTDSDRRVYELVEQVGEPMNLVSYHLKKLRDDGVVSTRRSEADGRDVYYSLDLGRIRDLYRAAGQALHPALSLTEPAVAPPLPPERILFVCTHNSARSQMAEGLLRHMSGGQIDVYSAGSHPTRLHPEAVRAMDALGIDIRGQQSQHLSAFEGETFSYVITVCDLAREVCPTFAGRGRQLHWGFADPAKVTDGKERSQVFEQTARRLQSRIGYFLQHLPEQETT